MTTIAVRRLKTTLSQNIRLFSDERNHIAAFLPYLLLYNSPVGTFTFELLNEDNVSIFSQDFDSSDIKDFLNTDDDYAHVFHPIIPTNPIQVESGLYTVKLSSSGYTDSENSYLGWIQQFENIQLIPDYTPTDVSGCPLSLRIKIYKRGLRE